MPEGPEVRRAADRIEKAVAGKPITMIDMDHPALEGAERWLYGAVLQRVQTFGKGFALCFDCGYAIYVHLQLYGVWRTGRLPQTKSTRRRLRLRLATDKHYAALYSATDISVWPTQDLGKHPYIRKLGPDLLRQNYKACHISRRLADKRFARRSLGALLLDQSFFAGIGNYLRSEILFVAKIHPKRTLGSLSSSERKGLAVAIHGVTLRAYQTGGITTSASYVQKAKAQGQTRRAYRHYVFGRVGKKCPTCQATIEKHTVAGRRLYFCRQCAPLTQLRAQ